MFISITVQGSKNGNPQSQSVQYQPLSHSSTQNVPKTMRNTPYGLTVGDFAHMLLRSAITVPTKNFFPSSLAPARSYPFPYDTPTRYSTGMSLNCTIPNYPPSPASTCTSLNCNLALTPHDMPSGLAGGLGHLGTHPDDMPSGHPDLMDTLGYRPEDMPSGPLDIHSEHVGHLSHLGHLGHLGYLGLLSHLGYLNTLDPEPIDIPLHAFIEEEGST
jgi:hypothetical protein